MSKAPKVKTRDVLFVNGKPVKVRVHWEDDTVTVLFPRVIGTDEVVTGTLREPPLSPKRKAKRGRR